MLSAAAELEFARQMYAHADSLGVALEQMRRVAIMRALEAGATQRQVSDALGLTRGRVSQIVAGGR
jgi:DNA-binding transcriptional regulator LsrR (DeoR family)